jgi:hypothetical protein
MGQFFGNETIVANYMEGSDKLRQICTVISLSNVGVVGFMPWPLCTAFYTKLVGAIRETTRLCLESTRQGHPARNLVSKHYSAHGMSNARLQTFLVTTRM